MKILLLSNQGMVEPFVGNPIMLRYRDALIEDDRITEVKMLRCNQPLKIVSKLREAAREVDLIHLHFGGLYALVTWILLLGINKPKYITFHGTDIHAKAIKTSKNIIEKLKIRLNQWASFLCIPAYAKSGFVAEEMQNYVPLYIRQRYKERFFVQPLGVNYKLFKPMAKEEAWSHLSLKPSRYVLFSDVNNTTIKRRDLAKTIVDQLPDYELLIMCRVNPNEVPNYINACEFLLLTSDEEGSPNIIRETLSLNKPVFSVDVGDVQKQLLGLNNSLIIPRDPKTAAQNIIDVILEPYTDNTRENKKYMLDSYECVKVIIDNIYKAK